jgi:hypothetical protein
MGLLKMFIGTVIAYHATSIIAANTIRLVAWYEDPDT